MGQFADRDADRLTGNVAGSRCVNRGPSVADVEKQRPAGHKGAMLSRLFGSRARKERHYAAPDGTCLYAIGDIHGRVDLLQSLHALIRKDIDQRRPDRAVVIYLGDYIDRGEKSSDVLDLLLDHPVDGAESIHLLGNHEDFVLTFLRDASVGEPWLKNGGDATMLSYAVGLPPVADRAERHRLMRDSLEEKLPERHLAFLRSLEMLHVEGDYAFVHAGIRPGRPLEDQIPEDVLWIRGDFLNSRADHDKCIVHGHTVTKDIDVRSNRIGIDTGAYFSNTLTCLVLEGTERAVLQT